ncbi:histone-lysine N-methyltransferase 2A isoform X2 [Amia ocellicauda]|uniref:histone-lysine N-methyltransferase 2A isoform X2 n=1 Tax=Amia ocellicauda TaxID=2972642 RepID=UPI003463FEDD
MAHSCRWRFPARPGGSSNAGSGRKAGRIRVTAALRTGAGAGPNASVLGPGFDAALQVSAAIGNNLRKFRDVFGEASGSSSGEEDTFLGFGAQHENRRLHSSARTPSVNSRQERKPRGRPPRALTPQRAATVIDSSPSPATSPHCKPEGPSRPPEKVKRPPGRPPGSGEKRRGRPPASGSHRAWQQRNQARVEDKRESSQQHSTGSGPRKESPDDEKERKAAKRTPLGSMQQQQQQQQQHGVSKLSKMPKMGRISKITKIKRLRAVKLAPLKARLKVIGRKGVPVPVVPRRRRGRPPSAERLKAEAAAAAAALASASSAPQMAMIEAASLKQKAIRDRRERDPAPHTPHHLKHRDSQADDLLTGASSSPHNSSPLLPTSPSRTGMAVGVRQSPRRIKPVRIVPPSKRPDATIAKQLLQRAKKGAQKKKMLEKEAVISSQGPSGMESGIRRRRRTQLKNIRQFIMPVVSTVSRRIIKTPKRFIEDEASFGNPPPHLKMPRLEPVPTTVASPPSSSTSIPVSTAAACAAASVGAVASIGTPLLPPPPPLSANVAAAAASLLNNNSSCNNSTSNGRFSSSTASCGSSAVSQHSSQNTSGESSRSSSPSLDSSSDSQASEGTPPLSEEPDQSPSSQGDRETGHISRPPSPPSEPEHVVPMERSRRGRRGQGIGRGTLVASAGSSSASGGKKTGLSSAVTGGLLTSSSQAGSQQASSTASSSSSPPPPSLLTSPLPPQPTQPASNTTAAIGDHHSHSPWIVPHPIAPFISAPSVMSPLQEKRRSILREPTFRWTSLSRSDQQYFSSAKYAKEGLIRKPIFDNFRPPPLTPEDVGLVPPSSGAGAGGGGGGGGAAGGFSAPGGAAGAGNRLFPSLHPHHHQHELPSSRFEAPLHKRSPLLRAPRFTPSEEHSRIYESVTLPTSSGGSPGSLSSTLQLSSPTGRTPRRKARRVFGPLRGQPRSPSHSMTTRSSQSGAQAGKAPSDLSPLATSASASTVSISSSLPGVAVSPLATSALTPAPFSTFSPGSMTLPTEGTPDSYQSSRRQAGGLGGAGDSFSSGVGVGGSSSSSSPLFPLFASSPQAPGGAGKGARERSVSVTRETASKEKEREPERPRDREKENKKDTRKERERRGKGTGMEASTPTPSLFSIDGKESEEAVTTPAPKKTPGRKKSISVDPAAETSPSLGSVEGVNQASTVTPSNKSRLSKKGRPAEKGQESETGEKEKEKEKAHPQTTAPTQHSPQPGPPSKQPSTHSLGSMLAQAQKQQVSDRKVAGLLKKAKAQLFKIEKSKSFKTADQPKAQGQESDSSETSARGPRIKHVCRRAAVALGRNRAVFPDDMPTLSALPWEEREKILSSMGNDDKSSVAGSEEAETPAPPIKPIKPVTRNKAPQEPPVKKGRRSRRCGQCPGCQVPEDCGVCTNCLDKPKFGGRNIKKQCCKMRKCQNLQWMPSKAYLQKQAKAKKEKKKTKGPEKKEPHHSVKTHSTETNQKSAPPPVREESAHKKGETPPSKHSEEKLKQKQQPGSLPAAPVQKEASQPPSSAPLQDPKQPAAPCSASSRKERKPQQPPTLSSQSHSTPSQPTQPQQSQLQPLPSPMPTKKEGSTKTPPSEPKKKPPPPNPAPSATEPGSEVKQPKKQTPRGGPPPKQKPKEKEKLLPTKPEISTLNLLSTPSTGGNTKQKVPCDGVHRIRVDFKEDCDIDNVWEMGGLSILTSMPITPRVICFLCASSGHVEFVFCQVCCEPFHLFCLDETERPLQEQWENWCCRRCRFCHVCGRQHQKTKQLLECNKCRNSYHPECLGPNHPTRPTKKKRVWICTKCVRCKSCGATTPGKSWDAQWSHDFSLCHDCAKLFAKGNFCPVCDKCYDDDDYESKMMQCGKCDRWVHAKCENLTDEMYEILSNLPESIAYTCINCTERHPAEWRTALEKELQGSVRQVLTALLNSRTSTHLLRYRQPVMKPPELNPEPEESLPSRSSPEGPDPPVLTEVSPPHDSPLDLETVKKKMERGLYNAVLEFSDDIVKIIQTAINSDGGQPENKKANSMVKSFFIRQMERVFPWFKVKESRFWEPNKVSTNSGLLPNAVLPPSLDHNYAQWQEREDSARAEQPLPMKKIIPAPRAKAPGDPDSPTPTPPPPPPAHGADLSREDSPELTPPPGVGDNRQCVLCLKYGDDNTNDGGRLLYIGQNEWTHVNCALWSAEVFEDDDGSLKNVHMAVIRGKQLRCEHCQRPGATVGCCLTSCTSNYHFMCARLRHCVFLEDKKVYCQRHRDLIKGEVVSETGFEVTRRILVDFEGISLRRKFLSGLEPENVHMMIGSMTIDCLGILTDLSDCERKLFPIGYQCSRVYWSTLDARKRCVYTCRILVCHPPMTEPDINSTLEHEENRTITHSPPSVTDVEMSLLPGSVEPPGGRTSAIQSRLACPKPQSATRNRHPSYPPCQRSPGSRPLPSAGGPFPTTHEIVTVGDPLLNSSLRSIGCRRHSTSSISPQQHKQRVTSPSRGGGALGRPGGFSSAPSLSSASRELVSWEAESRTSNSIGNQIREAGTLSPGAPRKSQTSTQEKKLDSSREGPSKTPEENSTTGTALPVLAGITQGSPTLGMAVLTSHKRSSSSSGPKTEKGKPSSAKDIAPSAGLSLASRHPLVGLPKEAGSSESVKEVNSAVSSPSVPSKDLVKPGSPPPMHHKGGLKKSREPLPVPAAAATMKPSWSSGAVASEDNIKRGSQAAPVSMTSLGIPNTKEKRSKVKGTGSREAVKEKEKTSQNNNTQTAASTITESISSNSKGSGKLDSEKFENQIGEKLLKSRERFPSTEKKSSITNPPEGTQPLSGSEKVPKASQIHPETAEKEAPVSQRKRTVKVTLTPLKMDPNGTKTITTSSPTTMTTSLSSSTQGSHKKSSRSLLFSSPSASSESSESEAQHPQEESVVSLLASHHSTVDDSVFGKGGPDGVAEHSLQDGGSSSSCGDKQHEDDSDGAGSVKRRYPRRSARARSNMFFGLTPFYGVRSYGEEDIPFYSSGDSSSGKKRAGGGGSKRSAEGQVDGADDMSTSSSGESGEEEEGCMGQGSDEDAYYYNFTRTIINPSGGAIPAGEMEQCLARSSQLHGFLKEESGDEDRMGEEDGTRDHLGRPRIGQLDGVDDGSESDTSVNTTSTTTSATTSTSKTSQNAGKRKGKESRAEKLELGSAEDSITGKEGMGSRAENSVGGGGNSSSTSNSRDTRKSQKDGNKMENCLPLGSVKSQSQDPLEAQLSLNTELLKSDSDNTNSDDCGNILPSDIMEFVLNTPSMQALGQQPETSSNELLSLEEGFGLDSNRGKDIGLFEDFSQQLPSTEPVESGVSASISGEEQYDLPLELPSDLSVLTTRSPSVANQNHSNLITEAPERGILSMSSEDTVVEKGGDKQRTGGSTSSETQQGGAGSGESQVTEGHMTPEHFIPTHIEADRMTSPPINQVVEPSSQDLVRTSGTPGLPSSPTIPLQGQKYMTTSAESPGPTQVASTVVQTTATHLKPGTEKLIVVNQHLQPLYVLQTLPNGVTQKIPIAPSVSTAGVMDTGSSVLSSMTGGLALAAGLNPGIPTSQSIFSSAGKGLIPMTHHQQIHAFTNATQASFQPGIPSTTSGLVIGVHHSQDPQILVSEAGHRPELVPTASIVSSPQSISPSSVAVTSGHGKKRPISRLQPRKTKKLARSGSQPTLAPSEVGPNMTLINFSPSQIATGIPGQSGLLEVGTLTTAAATSHRTVPNIIKRPKSGVMYFEQAPLLPQGMVAPAGQPGILGHESTAHLVPCTMSGLNQNQQVLNVVSMPTSGPGNLLGPGSVSLSTSGLLGHADLSGSISSLLRKASQQSLGLPEHQMVLQPGTGMISQLSGQAHTPNTSSICVLPSPQTISMSVTQPADQEGSYNLQHHPVTQMLTDKPQPQDRSVNANTSAPTQLPPSSVVQDCARARTPSTLAQSSRTTPISRAFDQQQTQKITPTTMTAAVVAAAAAATSASGKGKHKVKRTQPSPDKGSGKKHKPMHSDGPRENQGATSAGSRAPSTAGARGPVSPEPMDIERMKEREGKKGVVPGSASQDAHSADTAEEKPKTTGVEPRAGRAQEEGSVGSALLSLLEQERLRRDGLTDRKPKKGLVFEICSDDGFQIRTESIEEAWKSLTDKVQEARSNARLKELSFEGVNGLRMLGVIHDAVVFLLEQLYGAKHCRSYKFRFHKPEEADEPPINPHGSARAEISHRRSVFDMFNFLASKHRQPPEYNPHDEEEEEVQLKSARRATSMDLPMPMRFRHLKKTSKEAVGVYRSAIHGRGLFCKRNIDAGEMVIEYSGNVIRSVLTDKREKYYDGKGIGCYMFRIDDYEVVDATMHGNAARFINHSCEPNCYSRVINIDGQKHIVIFAMRKIYRGEELTYDYKFPIEDASNKLPCNCGAKKCRKFLN